MKKLLMVIFLSFIMIGAAATACYASDPAAPAPTPAATELPVVADPSTVAVTSATTTDPNTNTTTANMTWTAVDPISVMTLSSGNIGANATLNIYMQDGWRLLAKVEGGGPSSWYGTVNCPFGTFVFENQAGLYIAPTAQVNVNNFIATTLNIPESSFLDPNFMNQNNILEHLYGSQYSQILNEGSIISTGSVALIASAVENRGAITAKAGSINLASGDKVTVSFDPKGLIQVVVDEKTSGKVVDLVTGSTVTDAVANSQTSTIVAHQVIMSAKTAFDIFTNAVNQKGIVKATKLENVNGVIRLVADNDIQVSGTIEANDADVIVASDKDVKVENDLTVKDGDLYLLADNDFDDIGAFRQSQGTIISTLNRHSRHNVTIQSSGETSIANIASSGDIILKQAGSSAVFTQWPDSHATTNGSFIVNAGVTLNAANTIYMVAKYWIILGVFNPQDSFVDPSAHEGVYAVLLRDNIGDDGWGMELLYTFDETLGTIYTTPAPMDYTFIEERAFEFGPPLYGSGIYNTALEGGDAVAHVNPGQAWIRDPGFLITKTGDLYSAIWVEEVYGAGGTRWIDPTNGKYWDGTSPPSSSVSSPLPNVSPAEEPGAADERFRNDLERNNEQFTAKPLTPPEVKIEKIEEETHKITSLVLENGVLSIKIIEGELGGLK